MNGFVIKRAVQPIDWTDVPASLKGRMSAVCRSLADCDDLVAWFGDPGFCPFQPVLLMVPGAPAPIMIIGDGVAPAAELRDVAVSCWSRAVEKIQKQGALLNFDDARERHGLMRREDVDAAVRQAMRDRIARHKAAPVTDPFRQPVYPNPTNRTLHKVAKSEVTE